MANYFRDCIDEVGLELEARGVELGYFNYVDEDVYVIADAEQMKRVINNIIGNSRNTWTRKKDHQYPDPGCGRFRQVEIEDNGRASVPEEAAKISLTGSIGPIPRNSAKGGSGIGLSIVKKIVGGPWGQNLGHQKRRDQHRDSFCTEEDKRVKRRRL